MTTTSIATNDTSSVTIRTHREMEKHPELVEALLTEQKEAMQRLENMGRMPLGWGLKTLIWGLRLYVVFMLVAVAFTVVNNLR